jgi:hypothetical protein
MLLLLWEVGENSCPQKATITDSGIIATIKADKNDNCSINRKTSSANIKRALLFVVSNLE